MINVITPFSRPENARLVRDHLSWQRVAVTWHPVVSSVALPVDCLRAWVKPLRTSVPAGADPFCWKLRAFVESGRIVDGERYGVLCDDDLYGDGVLRAVAGMSEPIVVVSMLRGHRVPDRLDGGYRHPIEPLVARPESMRPGGVGLQQCFVTGEVLRQAVFDLGNAPFCDGLVAQGWAQAYGELIRYEPELTVLFNRLEPGRWAVDDEEVERWR